MNPVKALPTIRLFLAALLSSFTLFGHAQASVCPIPGDDLVAHWAADGNGDDSAWSHHGTLQGSSGYATGMVNTGFNFDGDTGYLQVPDSNTLDIVDEITISAWIKPETPYKRQSIVSKHNIKGGGGAFQLTLHESNRLLFTAGGDRDLLAMSHERISPGIFTHVAVTVNFKTNTLMFYINGKLDYYNIRYTYASIVNDAPVLIGGLRHNGQLIENFAGVIDDVRLHSRALDRFEIAEIYRNNGGGSENTNLPFPGNDLIGYWEAEGNAGDSVGSHHGVALGGVGYGTGRKGQGFELDGQSGFIAVSDAIDLRPADALTISAWVRRDEGDRPLSIISKRAAGNPYDAYSLSLSKNGHVLFLTSGDVFHPAHSTTPVPIGELTHVAVTVNFNTNDVHFFINGKLDRSLFNYVYDPFYKNTDAYDDPEYHGSVLIGALRHFQEVVQFFPGMIDEVALYNRDLSYNEIYALYRASGAKLPPIAKPAPPLAPYSGLVGHWTGNGDTNDLANGHNGTAHGGNDYTPAMLDQGFALDGSRYITVPDSPELALSNELTISAWIKPDSVEQPGVILAKRDGSVERESFSLVLKQNGKVAFISSKDYSLAAQTLTILKPHVFTHVAATVNFDTDTVTLYVNGKLDRVFEGYTSAPVLHNEPLSIGAVFKNGTPTAHFAGVIDELMLHNRVLTEAEIEAIYLDSNGGSQAPPALNAKLISHWKGEDNADDSHGANHGTLLNGFGFSNGIIDRSFQFGGAGGYVSVRSSRDLQAYKEMTFLAWVRPDAIGKRQTIISKRNDTAYDDPYNLTILESGELLFTSSGDTSLSIRSQTVLTPGVFVHVAVIINFDTDTVQLYINGELDNVYSGYAYNPTYSHAPVLIGVLKHRGRLIQGLSAAVDELSIFNRALTRSEIRSLQNSAVYTDCGTLSGGLPPGGTAPDGNPGTGAPTADAGTNQSAALGDTVTLSGATASDPGGAPLTYNWILTAPDGSDATHLLSDPTSLAPSFTTQALGDYSATLIVNNGSTDSAPSSVIISVTNSAPLAVVTVPGGTSAIVGQSVAVDGSASYDPDGHALRYSWTLTTPAGSSASLSSINGTTSDFTTDVPGNYVVSLIVNDGFVDSVATSATVTVINNAPVAVITPPASSSLIVGQGISLDGSGSYDADGHALSYQWSLSAPAGSSAALSSNGGTTSGFTTDVPGNYVATLIVNDGYTDSIADTVTIVALTPAQKLPDLLNLPGVLPRMQNKLQALINMFGTEPPANGIDKLIGKTLIPRTDGCPLRGQVDLETDWKTDWVTDCDSQQIIYEVLILIIGP